MSKEEPNYLELADNLAGADPQVAHLAVLMKISDQMDKLTSEIRAIYALIKLEYDLRDRDDHKDNRDPGQPAE